MADPPLSEWLARLQAAQPAEVLLRLANLEAQQTTSTVALAALVQKIVDMEGALMATVEEFAARLDTASTAIGARITDLSARVQEVVDLIPAERRAAVEEALASLDDEAARLEAWGQDPQNPVPDPEPTPDPEPAPGDGEEPAPVGPSDPVVNPDGSSDVINPTPGSE